MGDWNGEGLGWRRKPEVGFESWVYWNLERWALRAGPGFVIGGQGRRWAWFDLGFFFLELDLDNRIGLGQPPFDGLIAAI